MKHPTNCPCEFCEEEREAKAGVFLEPFPPSIVDLCDQAFGSSQEWPATVWNNMRRSPGYARFAPVAFFREWVNLCDATERGLPFNGKDAGAQLIEEKEAREKAERQYADLHDSLAQAGVSRSDDSVGMTAARIIIRRLLT